MSFPTPLRTIERLADSRRLYDSRGARLKPCCGRELAPGQLPRGAANGVPYARSMMMLKRRGGRPRRRRQCAPAIAARASIARALTASEKRERHAVRSYARSWVWPPNHVEARDATGRACPCRAAGHGLYDYRSRNAGEQMAGKRTRRTRNPLWRAGPCSRSSSAVTAMGPAYGGAPRRPDDERTHC